MPAHKQKVKPMKTDIPTKNTIKAKRSLIAGIGIAALAIFSLVGLGMKLQQARYETPLPANQACLTALDLASKALVGEQVDLVSAVKTCRENATKYEVVAK